MKRTLVSSLVVLSVLVFVRGPMATPITIDNHSFEEGEAAAIDVPLWEDVDMVAAGSPIDSPYSVYQGGPNAENYFPDGGVVGDFFLLVDGYQAGFYAYQNTGVTFVPDKEYTLRVNVGRRADHDPIEWAATPWSIALHYADDGAEAASVSGEIPIGNGGVMTNQTLVYTAQAGDDGREIQVRIGQIAAPVWEGQSTGYDNVRLDTDFEGGLLGDLNGDGFVGGADLDIVRSFWGQNVTAGNKEHGDPSGDGFVGGDDLDEVRAHWGEGTPPAPTDIPEPSTLALLCGGLLGLLAMRRRPR